MPRPRNSSTEIIKANPVILIMPSFSDFHEKMLKIEIPMNKNRVIEKNISNIMDH